MTNRERTGRNPLSTGLDLPLLVLTKANSLGVFRA